MELKEIRLHRLSLPLRLAVTCLVLILGGGYLASVFQMIHHYHNKDEQPALTMDDLIGSFHGLNQPARLLEAVKTSMRPYIPTEEEYQALLKWLGGNRISEGFDSLELGDFAPAEILGMHCLRCHARGASEGEGIGDRVPLEYWNDVKQVAFSKNLDPVPIEILTTSTHTHALTMSLLALAVSLLFLATSWPRALRHGIVFLTFAALLLDLGSWWLAREYVIFCYVLVASGGCFGALSGLQLIGIFLGTWFGGLFKKGGA